MKLYNLKIWESGRAGMGARAGVRCAHDARQWMCWVVTLLSRMGEDFTTDNTVEQHGEHCCNSTAPAIVCYMGCSTDFVVTAHEVLHELLQFAHPPLLDVLDNAWRTEMKDTGDGSNR